MRVETFNRGGHPQQRKNRLSTTAANILPAAAVHVHEEALCGMLDPGVEQLGDLDGRFLEAAVADLTLDPFNTDRAPLRRRNA